MQGKVKFYNDAKGFGFIIPEDLSDQVFFHISQWDKGFEPPVEGDEVTYQLGSGKDGRPAAQNVVPVNGRPAANDEEM